MKRLVKKAHWTLLDILATPSIVMTRKSNAKFHLDYICPSCPVERRKLREINGSEGCYWNNEWSKGNHEISRSFGVLNFFSQYFFGKTNLDSYRKKE